MSMMRSGLAAVAIVLLGVILVACAPERENTTPMPVPAPTASPSASPSVEAHDPDPDPTLLPGGTALANRDYFDFVNERLLEVNPNPSSEAIIANLISAGFAKDDLEVTPDKTSQLRRPSDSIEFSVRTSDGCLIGQFQSSSYASMTGPVLSGGTCLLGRTLPIP